MSSGSRVHTPLPLLRRAALAATATLALAGLVALLLGGPLADGLFVACACLMPSALVLVGAPRPGRPAGGALAAALLLGALLLGAGLALASGRASLALLLGGLGLAPLAVTLALYTLRFDAEQAPTEDETEALRGLGDDA